MTSFLSYLTTADVADVAISSPWWGVPAITATAVLFGALVAFLSARASDGRKDKRDIAERIMIDSRNAGLEYLDSVDSFTDLIALQKDPNTAVDPTEYVGLLHNAYISLRSKRRRFEFFAHDDALATGIELDSACFGLLMGAVGRIPPVSSVSEINSHKFKLVNILRKASGVGELSHDFPSPEYKEKIATGLKDLEVIASEYLSRRGDQTPPHDK